MNKKKLTSLIIIITFAFTLMVGCASSPSSIKATYVPASYMDNLSCEKLKSELKRVGKTLDDLTEKQKAVADKDAGNMLAFGLVGLMAGKSDDYEDEIANLKGEYKALETTARSKGCQEAMAIVTERKMTDGTPVVLRPIKPEDEPMWHDLVGSCSTETLRSRFAYLFKKTTHKMATRYCFIDYDREIAIVAEIDGFDHTIEQLHAIDKTAVYRAHIDAECNFTVQGFMCLRLEAADEAARERHALPIDHYRFGIFHAHVDKVTVDG